MDKPQPLAFQDLPEPLRREWAALPVTGLFLRYMADLRQYMLEESARSSLMGAPHRASSNAGAFEVIELMTAAIASARVEPEDAPQEEPFRDPADRRPRHGR